MDHSLDHCPRPQLNPCSEKCGTSLTFLLISQELLLSPLLGLCTSPEFAFMATVCSGHINRTNSCVKLHPQNPFFQAAFMNSVNFFAASVEGSKGSMSLSKQDVNIPSSHSRFPKISPKTATEVGRGGSGWRAASSLPPTTYATLLVPVSSLLRVHLGIVDFCVFGILKSVWPPLSWAWINTEVLARQGQWWGKVQSCFRHSALTQSFSTIKAIFSLKGFWLIPFSLSISLYKVGMAFILGILKSNRKDTPFRTVIKQGNECTVLCGIQTNRWCNLTKDGPKEAGSELGLMRVMWCKWNISNLRCLESCWREREIPSIHFLWEKR